MKKKLFLLLFLPLFATSQTKTETEDWIISKFNKWKSFMAEEKFSEFELDKTKSSEKLEINGCEFKITNIINTASTINGKVIRKRDVSVINIGDIDSFSWSSNGYQLFIKSRKTNILVQTYDYYTKKLEYKTYVKGASFIILTDSENDLGNRILKALNHLKSFCEPSIDKKETF